MPQKLTLTSILNEGVRRKASDVHVVAGAPISYRIDGDLVFTDTHALGEGEAKELACSMCSPEQIRRLERFRELDFGFAAKVGIRFRINVRWQQRTIAMTARIIPTDIPKPDDIGFTETLYGMTHLVDGLVLVTGPAGSGKSTTLATMIDIINTERCAHIITIEDPIEYLHHPKKSLIEQREVHDDTRSFESGVKYALRQDPDVLLVGEMRDRETMQAALTAAETGHLVLSTLHTRNAPETIDRIIDLYPPFQQHQIRQQLANVLRGVICQVLLPRKRGGRVAAREILVVSHAIANLIRENDIAQIPSHMQMGVREGMRTMNASLDELFRDGLISEVVARNRKTTGSANNRYF